MASSLVREVWSSWTIAPVWTGCSFGAVCSGTATCAWRRSALRLRWRWCQASVGVLVYHLPSFLILSDAALICSDTRSAGWTIEVQGQMSRWSYTQSCTQMSRCCCSWDYFCIIQAGLCRWPASSSSIAVGRRIRSTWRTCWTTSVISESRCSCCSSLKARTLPVRRRQSSIHSFKPHSFHSLFSETQQHLSCTFALTLLCTFHFQMLKHGQILQGTPRQSLLKMLWSFSPCSNSTTDA